MKTQNRQKETKFPENLALKALLHRGDYKALAATSGYSSRSIGDIFNGHRRLNDRLKKALAKLIADRTQMEKHLQKVAEAEVKEIRTPEHKNGIGSPSCSFE